MAQLITYRERPVKRRSAVVRKGQSGLLLVFYAATPGEKGDTQFVTDADWKKYGKVEQCARKPDVRALAANRKH